VGVERAHVWGGCIGVMYALRLAATAPQRVSGIVGQDPVGLDETNSLDVFMRMFEPTLELARERGPEAVVASAVENPVFMANNAGGPYARRIAADGGFREQIAAMTGDEYIAVVERFAQAIWPNDPPLLTVTEEWLRGCAAPLLILPGSDAFHPTGIAQMICRTAPDARCLDVDCRSDEKKPATIEAIRSFLREYAK
jgi:pimeloyl-ACP methyl ester carboxylesterase